ncbi:MAG: WD40/YVTN/BNR-like repeat-containing protein, partial [Candidatus Kapaibacterium sp.]
MRTFFQIAFLALLLTTSAANAQPNVWVQSNGPYGGFVNCLVKQENRILAGNFGGIFATSDQGTNWSRAFPSLGVQGIDDMAIAPDGTIIVATNGNGILVSTDGGTTWNSGGGLEGSYPSQVFVSRSGNYFALASNVYKSTDRGATWHLSGGASSP